MLNPHDFQIHGASLIEYSPLVFQPILEADWLFFYSKQGIRFYFENSEPDAQHSTEFQYAVFGEASAKFLKNTQGIAADFVGTGDANTTSPAFLERAKGQKVVFIRGQHSRRSVQEFLGTALNADERIVYNNTPKQAFKIPICDYLIFTSPLNVQTYYKHYQAKPTNTVVAIGPTTATALLEAGIEKLIIAEQPSEQKLAEIVLSC